MSEDPVKDQLINAVQMAYRKHHLADDSIGWDELGTVLLDALCDAMGDREYQVWVEKARESAAWIRA